jgi:hypothetical protein
VPFWGKKKNQEDQPEEGNVRKKNVPAKGTNIVVDKRINPENKIVEKECQKEIQQLKVLRRMRNDPSWDLAVETLLLCEKNPSDGELIAAAINRKRVRKFSRFQHERYLGSQESAKEETYLGPSERREDGDTKRL